MSVVRTGSTKQFAEGWDKVFGGGKTAAKKKTTKATKATKKKAKKNAKR
ncbi:MAG: hypothetical protein AAF790_04860 [Planctomycetota bacterium]